MGFNLQGFDELGERLGRLGEIMEYLGGSSAAKSALRKAGNAVTKDAKGRLTPLSKRIKPAIKTRIQVDAVKETLGEMGINFGKEKRAHHAHLVENGHMNFNQLGGPYGRTPPHPFWRPALKAKKKTVLSTMTDITIRAIKKQWRE